MGGLTAGRGIAWATVAATLAALFAIPWKAAAQSGEHRAAVLAMLATAALLSTALVPWARRARRRRAGPIPVSRAEIALTAQLGLLTLAGNWASAAAIRELSPSLLVVLLRSEVLMVAILAWALLRERVERRFWPGVALAGLGLVWIHGLSHSPGSSGSVPGLLWGLGAAAAFGTMTVITRRVIHRIDPVRVNAMRLWVAVALWFPLNGAPPAASEWTLPLVGYSALAALCGPVCARLCLMYSTRHVDARVPAMISLGSPVLALALAWLLLGDWPASHELAGGALMLLGIAIPMTGWLRRPSPGADSDDSERAPAPALGPLPPRRPSGLSEAHPGGSSPVRHPAPR